MQKILPQTNRNGISWFLFINNGVRPLSSKVQAIKAINVQTKVRNMRRFVGIVNYYRDNWRKRAHSLSPLTNLCSTKVNFKWTDVENNAFMTMKRNSRT